MVPRISESTRKPINLKQCVTEDLQLHYKLSGFSKPREGKFSLKSPKFNEPLTPICVFSKKLSRYEDNGYERWVAIRRSHVFSNIYRSNCPDIKPIMYYRKLFLYS